MTSGTDPTRSYAFDASSSLTTLPDGATGTYDPAGELTPSVGNGTTTNYAYDAAGQWLKATQDSTTVASGSWNGVEQLASYNDAAANMTAATYDATGHRTATTTTPAGGSSTTQDYVWNEDNLLMDSANAYIYTNGNAPAEQVNLSTGAITYLSTDSLGSVRGTVDNSGNLTGTTRYDAWGNPQTAGGLTATTPFGYAGGYTDPTGLIYLVNRYYDPATGQFTSLDPEVGQTLQPYAYTTGNPVSQTDPTGLYATGACTHAVPSCRFDRALNHTYHELQKIIGSGAYETIKDLNNLGFHKSAAATFGTYMRPGGAWDVKTHLRTSMGTFEHGRIARLQ